MQASRDDNSGHSVEEDDADTPGLSSPSQVSAFDSLPTTPYVGTESTVGRGSPLACEQQPQAHLRAKPPLSPVAVHRSPSRKTVSGGRGAVNASTFPRTPCSTSLPTSRLGAVASLAVDGGLSEADLQKLGVGQDLRLYCATAPAGFSSSDGDIAEVRNCLEKRCYQWRSGTRFSRLPTDRAFHRISHHHHTAPPGTVSIHPNYLTVSDGGVGGVRSPPATSQETNPVSRTSQRYQRLYRRNRVTRCDICLSSPTSKNTSPGGGGESGAFGMCSFNSSRRTSPLHLTRVGGIVANVSSTAPQGTPSVESSRKDSVPLDASCTTSPTGVVRLGPGNTLIHAPFEGTGFIASSTTTSTTTIVTTTAPNYVRINWCAQPYMSISPNSYGLAARTESAGSDVTGRTGQYSTPRNIPSAETDSLLRLSVLSDGNLETQPSAAPVSPSAQSTSSVPLTLAEKNSCTTRTQAQDFHFFGASHTTARSVERPTVRSALNNIDPSSNSENSGEAKRRLQARIYQQHVARSVRHLRRYRHIYGDSLNSVPGATRTNPCGPSEESAEGRRCSADAALAVSSTRRGSSAAVIPPGSAFSPQEGEETNNSLGESQLPDVCSFPVATVIACLQNSSKKKPTWLHRRCFVHNGYLFLTSLTENIPRVLETTLKPSTCPPSLCKSVWCYPLSECAFSWSPLSSVVQESVAQSGLLGSSQLHPLGCSFSVPATDCLSCGYTCKIFFLQRENLNDIIQGLQRISASQGPTVSSSVEGRTQTMESSSTSSSSPSGLASLLTGKDVRGKNYGLAGPVGAFPLMVAAETLAASFGVHMNRSAQTISVRSPPTAKLTLSSQCGSTSVTIPKDAISARDLHESVASTTTESVPNVQNLAEQEKTTIGGGGKGRLLRSTFARMKQAAFSSSSSSSACSPNSTAASQSRTASSKFAPTATTKAFQQRRPFFSSSTTSCTLSSPEPLQQGSTQAHDWHHSFHATLETEAELLQQQEQQPDSWNQAQASPDQRDENGDLGQSNLPSSVLQPEAKGATVATTICIPLTATLEPTYSVLQSFNNEADPAPVSAHELPVTSPVQVAIVDSTLFTQSSSGPLVSESTTTTAETTEEEKANEAVLTASTISSTSASVSMTTSKTSTASKETVIGKTKQFLRRPNDSSYTAEANAEEPTETAGHQAKQSHRSQLGSLALHRCPRSTVSPFVPFIVELCVTLVERFGLNCVGIYRVSGNKVAHDFISSELTNKMDEIDTSSDKWNDINAVSCVLKTFLRNLPDSLIPKMMYSDFLAASRLESWERRLLSVQRLLGIMECYVGHPEYRAHRATLRYLATHLARVASRQSVNRMTPYNLALVFAPNLVQPSEDSPELFIADSKFKIWLVETIIKYHKWVFSPDLGLESGCFVPEDSDEIAEIEARSDSPTVDSSGTGAALPAEEEEQPGRAEGDVRPILRELLSAAAQLPPPPSESDLESAEEPGPSIDRPAPVTVAAALLSRKGSSRVVDTSNRRQSSSSLPSTDRIGEGESECEASSLKGTPGSSMQTQLSPIERARLDRLSFLSADPTLPHLDPTTILKSSEQPSEKSPSTSLSPKGELQCFTSFSSLPPEPCLENLSGGPSTPRPSPQPLLFIKSAPSTPLPEDSLLDADVTATGKFLTLPVTGVGPSVTPPCGPRKKFASSGSHHGLHLFGGSERGRRLSLSSESMVSHLLRRFTHADSQVFSLKPTAAAAAAATTITTTTATVPLQAQEAAPTPSDENADLSSPAVKRSSLIRPRLIRLARIHTIGPTFSGRHAPKR